ncbi:MAG: hprK, partial [Haloplasmataceae bacterium]|nr:hprK [Haloplasmataceae bacterium]
MSSLTVKNLIDTLGFEVIAGNNGINRPIQSKMISRPGLELAGLFDFYEENRIQVIGSKEVTFFYWLNETDQNTRIEQLFREKTPAFIFSNNFDIPEVFRRNAEKYNIPILRSNKHTTHLMNDITLYLQEELAETTNMHGVLVDVHGIGTLIRGKSGIGKSEAALELVKRGHK